jgi:hypothetical protein
MWIFAGNLADAVAALPQSNTKWRRFPALIGESRSTEFNRRLKGHQLKPLPP